MRLQPMSQIFSCAGEWQNNPLWGSDISIWEVYTTLRKYSIQLVLNIWPKARC